VFEGPSGLELESEEAARAALKAQRIAAEASAAAAAKAEAQRRAEETARAVAEAAAEAETAPPAEDECIGYGCSPEQDAELNEWERAANDDYGPAAATRAGALFPSPSHGLRGRLHAVDAADPALALRLVRTCAPRASQAAARRPTRSLWSITQPATLCRS
jgi:hypothetical protein